MKFLHLTLLCFTLGYLPANLASEYPSSSPVEDKKFIAANPATTDSVYRAPANIVFQSNDGGRTWHDISEGLPGNRQPEAFFAGESEVYMRVEDDLYRSKSNLKTPVWEKESASDTRGSSIAFNRSGVIAYNEGGQFLQRMAAAKTWMPVYKNFKKQMVDAVFETPDGTVFVGCRNGLYKSIDKGVTWKQVHNEGWVMDLAESNGVLIATGQKGIMRSTDNGEHWEWVISEGGVGIDVERIDGGFAAITFSSGANARRIRISLDNGKTWEIIDEGLPRSLSISSITHIGKYLICGHPDGIFRSSDMGKTWNMVHPGFYNAFNADVKTWSVLPANNGQTFKIFASGNVLYAVTSNFGC